MRLKGLIKLFTITLFSIGMASITTNGNNLKASAIDSRALKDDYYKGLDTNLKGQPFIDDLSTIINNGAKIGTYAEAYTRLCDTDEDPNNKGNIVCFYTGVSYKKGTSGSNRQWNREHVWAKSHGFKNEKFKAYGDIHHLRATEMKINQTRSNYDFDDVENHKGTVQKDKYGNKWINGTCFEPRDEVKGDVARMMFYMVTMYNGHNSVSLELHNHIPSKVTNDSGFGEFGGLNTLIKWHQEDPVDATERRRNEVIYGYQNNRNPYIDHPEYVANAFNVDIVLPDNPDNPNPDKPTINEYNVKLVMDMIDKIPTEITLEAEVDILNAKAVYDTLNNAEMALVTNYDRLAKALKELEALKNPDLKPEPEIPPVDEVFENTTIDMKKHGIENHPYMPNYRFNIGSYKFEATHAGVTNSELRLGDNKNRQIPAEYKINGNGVVLKLGFKVKDIRALSINIGNVYGKGLYRYSLQLMDDNNSLSEIAKGNIAKDSKYIGINLDKSYSGRLHLVFVGKELRLSLNDISLVFNGEAPKPTPDPDDTKLINSFIAERPMSRLKLNYNTKTKEVNSLALEVGGSINKNSFKNDKNIKYGLALVDSNMKAGMQAGKNKISSLLATNNSYMYLNPKKGDANGNSYRLDWSLGDVLNDLNKGYRVAYFMEYNGKLYLSNINEINVLSIIELYNSHYDGYNDSYKGAIDALNNLAK